MNLNHPFLTILHFCFFFGLGHFFNPLLDSTMSMRDRLKQLDKYSDTWGGQSTRNKITF